MSEVFIYGSGDFGQVLKPLVLDTVGQFAGFIDDWNTGDEILGSLDAVLPKLNAAVHQFVLAIGYRHLKARWEIYQRLRRLDFQFPTLIHRSALVHGSARVDEGAVVMMGAIIDVNVRVGPLAVLWPGATVAHDTNIGSNSFVSPRATVCGRSTVGRDCFIGAGAVVVDHVAVPDGSLVKAGTVFHRRSTPTPYRVGDPGPE